MGINHTLYALIIISISCEAVFGLEEKIENDISTIWKLIFISVRKYYIESSSNSLYIKKDICDYNPVCLMSSGLIFDDIIMNMISNKAL